MTLLADLGMELFAKFDELRFLTLENGDLVEAMAV
jgi:hypothetical protein